MPKVTDITERIGAQKAAQAELDDFREFAAEPESMDFMERQRKARVKAAVLEAPRQKSLARFEKMLDSMDDRTGQRQDPSRAGGRRVLDTSAETVERMSVAPPWESRSFGTAGSSQQFDWFDKADPFERYSITQEAYKVAGVTPPDAFRAVETNPSTELRTGMTAEELAGREKMVAARRSILAADPRSAAELSTIRPPVAAATPPPGPLAQIAEDAAGMGSPLRRAGSMASGVFRRALPVLAGAGALLAASEAEGDVLNRTRAGLRSQGFDVLGGNLALMRRLGLVRENDNTL